MNIALISCVKSKKNLKAPAIDLYISPLFKGYRRIAEIYCDKIFILSAKYYLLDPKKIISPYNETLNKKSKRERFIWSFRVYRDLLLNINKNDIIYWFAGNKYKEFLQINIKNK